MSSGERGSGGGASVFVATPSDSFDRCTHCCDFVSTDEDCFVVRETEEYDGMFIHRECVREISMTSDERECTLDPTALVSICRKRYAPDADVLLPTRSDAAAVLLRFFPPTRIRSEAISVNVVAAEPTKLTCRSCDLRSGALAPCICFIGASTWAWWHVECFTNHFGTAAGRLDVDAASRELKDVFGHDAVVAYDLARKLRKHLPSLYYDDADGVVDTPTLTMRTLASGEDFPGCVFCREKGDDGKQVFAIRCPSSGKTFFTHGGCLRSRSTLECDVLYPRRLHDTCSYAFRPCSIDEGDAKKIFDRIVGADP